jgi:hypothetical protein
MDRSSTKAHSIVRQQTNHHHQFPEDSTKAGRWNNKRVISDGSQECADVLGVGLADSMARESEMAAAHLTLTSAGQRAAMMLGLGGVGEYMDLSQHGNRGQL